MPNFGHVLSHLIWMLTLISAVQSVVDPPIHLQSSPTFLFDNSYRSHKAQSSKSVLTRLRDGLIQLIWKVPSEKPWASPSPSPRFLLSKPTPPSSLLARYGGDVVLRFQIRSAAEASALSEAITVLFLDVWEHTSHWVDIRLSKDVVPSLLGLLPASLQHAHTPLMHDLAQAIFESYPSTIRGDLAPSTPEEQHTFSPNLRHHGESTNLYFRDYQPLEVMLPWMRLLTSLFPTHVRMVNIGVSYEGRNITALRVGVHPTNSEKPAMQRKTIIVAGGSHAREWISTSTVSYIAYSFITGYGKSRTITKQIEEYDWIFIPTLNPDGYVYTWETDRLWRKNRQRTALQFCQGVDLDRAYGFEWDNASSKNNPCSESFSGEGPFEAVESRRFADWVRNETENNNSHFVGFLDLHSYSQQVLYPYSYSCASAPPSLENLEELAIGLAKAIRLTNGNNYGVTSACEGSVFVSTSQKTLTASKSKQRHQEGWPQMETGGGSALDWFYHDLNVRYSYQIKLRDTGSYGFLLPSSNIVSTGEEALSAVQYFGQFLLGNNGIEASANTSVTKDELNSNEQQQQQTRLTRESSEEPKMLVNEGSARWKTEGEKEEEEQEEEDRERTDEGSKSRWDLRKRRR